MLVTAVMIQTPESLLEQRRFRAGDRMLYSEVGKDKVMGMAIQKKKRVCG
jgi:hypothetical protein